MQFTRFKLILSLSVLFLALGCTQTSSSKRLWGFFSEPEEEIVSLDLDEIKRRGYITAILDNSSTGLFIYRGETMGYEYELLQRFAKSQGLELRINIIKSLEEGFRKLNKGEGDILAYNLTVTKDRKNRIAFTHYHNQVRQVLVQRKPDNWRELKLHELEQSVIRNPVNLIGKEVHVRHHSSYFDRLQNLSEEIGGDIIIIQEEPEVETESIIRKVAEGSINFTVAEEDIALVNATYYPNLDVSTPVSFPTQIAWGVRKTDEKLLDTLNEWIMEMRTKADYYVIYDKYFKSRKSSLRRTQSDFFSLGSGTISPYDSLIKVYAPDVGWDWRLLAAQIYQESWFDPHARSWAGAVGLMQLLPLTARDYGVRRLTNPERNIYAGTRHLMWLINYFTEYVPDPNERMKFVLAAYNVGHGHVVDAIRLTVKYGGDPKLWSEVSVYLLKKSEPEFYNRPEVQYGYCRGQEPVDYVNTILTVYENYVVIYPDVQ